MLEMHYLLVNFMEVLIQIIPVLYLSECKWDPGEPYRDGEDPVPSLLHPGLAAGQEGTGGTQSPGQHLLPDGGQWQSAEQPDRGAQKELRVQHWSDVGRK
jgi:hypothetical protein